MSERLVRRLHLFLDGFGWSQNRNADYSQLSVVRDAKDLPPLAPDVFISFANADDTDDLGRLQDMIQELRSDAHWHYNEEDPAQKT